MAAKKKTTKAKAETHIVIPALDRKIVQLRLVGTDILVTNNAKKLVKVLGDQGTVKPGGKKSRPARDPQQEYIDARYIIDENTDGFPAYKIKDALIFTAYTFAPVDRTVIRGAVYVHAKHHGKYVPIECDVFPPPMRTDTERVGSGASKNPDLRYRPEYVNWSIPVDVEYESNIIDLSNLVNLFAKAGFHVGLGEHRPQKGGGTWGRFEVMFEEEWQKLRAEKKGTAVA